MVLLLVIFQVIQTLFFLNVIDALIAKQWSPSDLTDFGNVFEAPSKRFIIIVAFHATSRSSTTTAAPIRVQHRRMLLREHFA